MPSRSTRTVNKEELRIYALEPVQIVMLSTDTAHVPSEWSPLALQDYETRPELTEVNWPSLCIHTRSFDPGMVVVPLSNGEIVPLVRVVHKPSMRPPCNSLKPPSVQPDSQHGTAEMAQRQVQDTLPVILENEESEGSEALADHADAAADHAIAVEAQTNPEEAEA